MKLSSKELLSVIVPYLEECKHEAWKQFDMEVRTNPIDHDIAIEVIRQKLNHCLDLIEDNRPLKH